MIISKGYLDVLFAVEQLVNRYHIDLHCTFIGRFVHTPDDIDLPDGISAEEYFFSYIKKHSLDRYITRIDGLYGNEKREIFLRSHVFLLPTYFIYEGQPVSIIEAMAYGNVPIVTNYRHIPSMVNLDNGFYVNPKAYMEIVDIILKLYRNQQEYSSLSRKNIDKYLKFFTFEQYCEKVTSFF
jgi:glycosyltransferase involved in cell wall biosynthesis